MTEREKARKRLEWLDKGVAYALAQRDAFIKANAEQLAAFAIGEEVWDANGRKATVTGYEVTESHHSPPDLRYRLDDGHHVVATMLKSASQRRDELQARLAALAAPLAEVTGPAGEAP